MVSQYIRSSIVPDNATEPQFSEPVVVPSGSGSVPAVPLLPEVVSLLASLKPGLLTVEMAEAAAVEVLVNLGGGEAGQHLFPERVVLDDAFPLAVVLVHAHGLETGCAREQFVGDVVVC
jgi:hypothetical protein